MNELTVSPERLAWLRSLCLGLPEASEKVAWGDPTWRVKDKIFAMQKGNYAGGRASLWLKGERGAQDTLVGADPGLFFVPPYVGHKGWIGVWLDGARLPHEVVADLVQESYRLVAPARLGARLGAADAAAAPRPAKAKLTKAKPTKAKPTKAKPTKAKPTKASAGRGAKLGRPRKKRPARRRAAR